ncbi:MAG: glycosyltransferase family 4 protein [Pseudomonadota bacterium]
MQDRLNALLALARRRDLLVLSDRYPPDAIGGAEISLHLCLSRADLSQRALVTVFSNKIQAPEIYWQDGVPVLRLPDADPWPIHAGKAGRHTKWARAGKASQTLYEGLAATRFLTTGGPIHQAADRAMALWLEFQARPRGGVAKDFSLGANWARRRAIRSLCRAMQPRTILLDNYRSILLAPDIRRTLPSADLVGVVRDNRFTCARHDQAQSINGTPCTSCSFACAEQDAKGWQSFHRRHLELSAQRRRSALACVDRAVVTSAFLEKGIRDLGLDLQIDRIPNPGGRLDEVADFMRGVAEWPGEHLLIIGMLNENKGQLKFLEHAADWLKTNPNRIIHLAGRGDRIAGQIRRLATRTGLESQIKLHGYLDRRALFQLARRCQIVLAPTVWPEPFGRVPLEAGLARRPIIAFARGGLCETIRSGTTGFLIEPGDYPALLAKTDDLLANPALCRQVGAAAHSHVSQRYGLDAVIEALSKTLTSPAQPA